MLEKEEDNFSTMESVRKNSEDIKQYDKGKKRLSVGDDWQKTDGLSRIFIRKILMPAF